MRKVKITVSGPPKSGKSTVAALIMKLLSETFPDASYSFTDEEGIAPRGIQRKRVLWLDQLAEKFQFEIVQTTTPPELKGNDIG